MAIILEFVCRVCNQPKESAVASGSPTPTICNECKKFENDQKRREHFHGLDGLTIEERLRKIEKWIYDYKPHKNINEIRF